MTKKSADLASTPLSELISLAGRTVLVTGAAAGMGRAIAQRMTEAGARLLLLDVDDDGLEQTRSLLPEEHEAIARAVDLADKEAIDHFWRELDEKDLPDVLVNNAGIFPERDFLKIDQAFWRQVMSVDLDSTAWMCQHFIARRGQLGGVIVNNSSIEAVLPFKSDMAHYAASKAGVLALTRSLARDYGRAGFRVNAIMPGGVNTPGTAAVARQAITKLNLGLLKTGYDFKQRLPLGRIGQADDIARAVIFLASDLSSYVHGVCLPVDGGFLSA